jgi:hypothetical protein
MEWLLPLILQFVIPADSLMQVSLSWISPGRFL